MVLLSGSNLRKMFADQTLFEDVSFNIYSDDKIGFIGVNGAGKSTLFKMLAGNMDYDGGELFKSKETNIGYLEQYMVSDGNIAPSKFVCKILLSNVNLLLLDEPTNHLDIDSREMLETALTDYDGTNRLLKVGGLIEKTD